jgi:hypothetical protein
MPWVGDEKKNRNRVDARRVDAPRSVCIIPFRLLIHERLAAFDLTNPSRNALLVDRIAYRYRYRYHAFPLRASAARANQPPSALPARSRPRACPSCVFLFEAMQRYLLHDLHLFAGIASYHARLGDAPPSPVRFHSTHILHSPFCSSFASSAMFITGHTIPRIHESHRDVLQDPRSGTLDRLSTRPCTRPSPRSFSNVSIQCPSLLRTRSPVHRTPTRTAMMQSCHDRFAVMAYRGAIALNHSQSRV